MQVEIACRHGSISSDVQQIIREKSEKLLHYFQRVTAIEVTFGFEGPRVNVEMLLDAEHKHNFVARDDGEDALAVFDSVLHKMEHQLKKYKERIQDHSRDVSLGVASDPAAHTEEQS